jgi:hypothetical protein
MDEVDGHTLLCRAARLGNAEAVQNFAKLEPNLVMHRCKKHGTPLAAALSRVLPQNIDTAKIIIMLLDEQRVNSLSELLNYPAAQDVAFIQWYLARQSLRRRWISHTPANAQQVFRFWSGPWAAEVPLPWEARQLRGESIIEYARRRQRTIYGLRGVSHHETRLVVMRDMRPPRSQRMIVDGLTTHASPVSRS